MFLDLIPIPEGTLGGLSLIYDLVVPFGALAAAPACMLRSLRHPEYRAHLRERFGKLPDPLRRHLAALPSRPVWIQAVSVGEVMLARALSSALAQAARERSSPLPIVVSSTTPAGRAFAADSASGAFEGVFHLPIDWAPFVTRSLLAVDPRALICIETEIWPALLGRCGRRGLPVLIANGRLSDRSARRYRRAAPLLKEAIGALAAVCAQTTDDAERFASIGVPEARIEVTGNLKFDLPVSAAAPDALRRDLALPAPDEAFVVVAGSTAAGEEELVLDAAAASQVGNLLLILAPRHRERFDEVARLLQARGIRYRRRSQPAEAPARVVLLDSMGELAGAYALADAAFVGGSLVRRGGQNLIEPAARGVPVLFGPHTEHFASVARALLDCGAGLQVPDAEGLAAALSALAGDPDARRRRGDAGRRLVERNRGATEATLRRLLPFLLPEPHPVGADRAHA